MYNLLSSEAKQTISKKNFTEHYKEIYEDFEITNLSIKPKFKLEEGENPDPDGNGKVKLAFSAKMDSFAGEIQFSHEASLIKEEREETTGWYIDWDTQMIFPALISADTQIHGTTLQAKRGEIVDRNGKGLAVNKKAISVGFEPRKMASDSKQRFSEITGIPVKTIEQKLSASWVQPTSFVSITTLLRQDAKQIEKLMKIPGVRQKGNEDQTVRVYPYGKAASHLIGYTAPITAEQLKDKKDEGYNQNDMIGRLGLERYYEDRLRGKDGGIIYTTDTEGNRLDVIAKTEPKHGETIKLTIDVEKQVALSKQLTAKNDAGTAVAINPTNGQVLALVSAPAYDPNAFIGGISNKKWKALNNDPQQPLLNRFRQIYVPGSVFKPITASIGLETGAITPSEERTIPANDKWQAGSNWGGYYVTRVPNPETQVNLQEAFVYSDNIYFAQTALEIGAEAFVKQAKQFGFDEKSMPFPYPIEPSQLTNEGSFENEVTLANMGYGQGEVLMSALHLTATYTPFVTGGDMVKPVLEMEKAQNGPTVWHENIMSSEIANTIKEYLVQVIANPNGTAHEAEITGITLAGKTGTAELKKSKEVENGKELGWFIAFDTQDPELMISMMIENSSSSYVIPKVTEVMKQFVK